MKLLNALLLTAAMLVTNVHYVSAQETDAETLEEIQGDVEESLQTPDDVTHWYNMRRDQIKQERDLAGRGKQAYPNYLYSSRKEFDKLVIEMGKIADCSHADSKKMCESIRSDARNYFIVKEFQKNNAVRDQKYKEQIVELNEKQNELMQRVQDQIFAKMRNDHIETGVAKHFTPVKMEGWGLGQMNLVDSLTNEKIKRCAFAKDDFVIVPAIKNGKDPIRILFPATTQEIGKTYEVKVLIGDRAYTMNAQRVDSSAMQAEYASFSIYWNPMEDLLARLLTVNNVQIITETLPDAVFNTTTGVPNILMTQFGKCRGDPILPN